MMGAAIAAVPGVESAAASRRPKPYREKNRVDIHAHYLSQEYLNALQGQGISAIGGIPLYALPQWTPENAMAFMDKWGIAVQMLSVSDPGVKFMPDEDAAGLARDCNEFVAGVISDHPDRFGGFAVVPLHDVDAANTEVDYAMDDLGLDGVGLLSSQDGLYLGDPAFDALHQNLNERGAWVFVHPTHIDDNDRPTYQIPDFIAEYPFDTTRTFISLAFNGVFAKYPNIRWHFAHGGGTLPMLRFRLNALAASAAEIGVLIGLPEGSSVLTERSIIDAIHASFFDAALIGDPPALEAVKGVATVDRMGFGSDWPFAFRLYAGEGPDPQPKLSKTFSNTERHQIDRLNARAEFPRLADIVPGS